MIWDVLTDSAFMSWFLLGAIVGLFLVIVMILRGFDIDFIEALGAIALCGLVAVGVRFVQWIRTR